MKQVMKKLCVLLTLMTMSVGAWAADYYLSGDTWHNYDNMKEYVVRIKIENSGSLADAIAEINTGNGGFDAWDANGQQFKQLYKDCDIVNITLTDGASLNDADIAALKSLTYATIDLQDAYNADKSAFTFTNNHVKNLILPDNWTKAEVTAAANAIVNGGNKVLGSVASQVPDNANHQAGLNVYINKPNTLRTTILHLLSGDTHHNYKMSSDFSANNGKLVYLKYLSVSGYPCARDLANGDMNFDSNGHFVFNEAAGEAYAEPAWAGISGSARVLTGEEQSGALDGASLIELDLEDAIVENQYCEDLTLSKLNILSANDTKNVLIPTYPGFYTLPADFMNTALSKFQSIKIPQNIQVIGARAFYGLNRLKHIYTDGPDNTVVYDNGAITEVDATTGVDKTFVYGEDAIDATLLYGTFTFSANIKQIQSHAFGGQNNVKDVYSLAENAPDCHVDAFNATMYVANNTYDSNSITDGIITREAYTNSKSGFMWMSMLHYPRECATPNIQRYTDVTRQYSVATGMRDGKGATLYLPNQTEFLRAFHQGTYGYLWNAWDPTRSDDGNNAITYMPYQSGYNQTGQTTANNVYTSNTYASIDKTDRVFYDTTDGGNLTRPEGQKLSTATIWEGSQLYPEAETVYIKDANGNQIYNTVVVTDENGNVQYVVDNTDGTYRKIGTYEVAENGGYVKEQTPVVDENGPFVKASSYESTEYDANADENYYVPVYNYEEDNNGSWIKNYTSFEPCSWDEFVVKQDYFAYDSWNNVYIPAESWMSNNMSLYKGISDGTYVLNNGKYAQDQSWKIQFYNQVNSGYTLLSAEEAVVAAAEGTTLYKRVFSDSEYQLYDATTDEGLTRYVLNDYREYNAETDEGKTRYALNESYVEDVDNLEDNQQIIDYGNYYSISTTQEAATLLISHDYRGWHQFVLTAYATNSNQSFTPYRTYISDNDWWTICLPFDMTRAELIKIYGTEAKEATATSAAVTEKIPYLSKLTYVVRDIDNAKITLSFSKNLLENKEVLLDEENNSSNVHGTVAEGTKPGDNDIVLHKGVPYLIRPYRTEITQTNEDGTESSWYNTQWDIYDDENNDNDLYDRISASSNATGSVLNQMIYDGEYVVPAYVVNDTKNVESVSTENKCTFTMGDNSKFTYDNPGTISYNNKNVEGKISLDYQYFFVGTFYLSLMPEFSYFLGWDSKNKRAAFWYNAVADKQNYTWNNETGIIMPNFSTSVKIDPASSLADPARWIISLHADDIKEAATKNRMTESMFGYQANLFDGEATTIIKVDNEVIDPSTIHFNNKGVYSLSGQYMGNSVEGLQKGIYIVNGKKMVIK